ncbi:mannitol dehydrogenase family protein [Salinarimonas soli]|uniref:Mannitol dehydrogenase family protein n=1 Tax=Salinarimonas soli TaxID=1638099 RepID=A0A5B2VFR0_9HYPH|nr:mannitol dehydrogenase family protein [Salinarimonas soli]KAA2237961.1 mannitol dehydrogenase family protein [Salinarimonas soli]
MDRISLDTLQDLPPAVARPAYDVAGTRVGVVHLGVGAFHRAHQAVYLDDRLNAGETGWGVLGASLRSPDTRDALAPQDGLYAVMVRSGEGTRTRVIGSLRDLVVAPEDPERLLAAMTDPAVRIVSLTVTEKGYCHDPATGTLREDHPDIRRDLASPLAPVSAPGFLVEAIRRRRAAGVPPFTVLTCDNLPANGETVHRVISRYAALVDPDLGAFVRGEVACPSTMVDRIVPATTEAERALAREAMGLEDAWPIATEPFTQWVIEDRFPLGRPRLEEAGAQLVSDVAPYELMKLRLLNGSHSTIAYLGYLAGHETVSDVMGEPAFVRLVAGLMDAEVTPTLAVPLGADLAGYKRSLIERFRNPALRHRTWQIAMDGSQKLPQRLLGTVRDRLRAGAPIDRLALGVAAWMRYVAGVDEAGRPIDVRDPLAARLADIANEAGLDAGRLAPALLGVREVFGEDLPADPRFTGPVTAALDGLIARGARAMVEATA